MKMRLWCRGALALTASFLFAALLGTVPAYAAVDYPETSIFMPVTIRDYVADGMLFEWSEGDHDGFGLLNSASIPGTVVQSCGESEDTSLPDPKVITLSNGIKETIYGGTFRTGLVEPVLGADKKPVYRQETIAFLADYLSRTLSENAEDVTGTELEELGGKSLAEILREQIQKHSEEDHYMGDYETARTKAEAGELTSIYDVNTYYEAAYFLLSDLFRDSAGYGTTDNSYDNIVLINWGIDEKYPYTFYSGYADTKYDREDRYITNTQNEEINGPGYSYGLQIPEDIFDPLNGLGYGNQDDSVNRNLVLESHGKFIYHEAENQYFRFTGDDDAYLYLNGILALDMGGSHPLSKAGIELNAIADRLGLVDGEMYDFDFFYMDRQGRNADFGIETNILLSNPSIVADKKVFQNQKYISYGGSVDPDQPVIFQYSLENAGNQQIVDLYFCDWMACCDMDKEYIYLNDDTSLSELLIERRNADGSEDLKLMGTTEEQLKQIMEEGLAPGQKLIIYGIVYQFYPSDWMEDETLQKEVFLSDLRVTAIASDDVIGEQKLSGFAEILLAKKGYDFAENHYYDWGTLSKVLTEEEKNPDILAGNDGKYALDGTSEGVSMTRKELLQTAVEAGALNRNTSSSEYRNAKIQICSPIGGTEVSNNMNSHATVQSDGSVFYQSESTGADTFYYQIVSGNKVIGPIPVEIYTYGVSNNTYVLDYGLPVELYADEDAGLTANDLMSLASVNPAETTIALSGIQNSTGNYGTFIQNGNSLIYKPDKIMNGRDQAQIKVKIQEKNTSALNAKTGIILTQTITIVPANVVYYEDDFEGLTYISEDGNAWAMYEGFDENGNSTAGEFQSADQESNYGSDPNYQLDHGGTLTLVEDVGGEGMTGLSEEELDRYEETLYGDASNDTIHVLNVQETADVFMFSFAGTGFEIVGRTTSEDYSVLSVCVTEKESGIVKKQFPVITESENGDLCQVPAIRVNELPYGIYEVSLRAAKSRATQNSGTERFLYIDGVRIYDPLDYTDAEIYYNNEEKKACIYEMRYLIQQGFGAVLTRGSDNVIRYGSIYIEDADENGFLLKETDSLDDYMEFGPNNELYLNGSSQNSAVLLWLMDLENEEEKSVQVGVHRKSDETTGSFGEVSLVVGNSFDDLENETYIQYVESGTENYYPVDLTILEKEEDRVLLLIGTTGSENEDEILALTSLKLSGYDICDVAPLFEEKMPVQGYADTPDEVNGINNLRARLMQMFVPALSLDSLKFKNDKVTAGKNATLLVMTDQEADSVIVQDPAGNEVVFSKVVCKQKDKKCTHTVSWKVEGTAGDVVTYTVYGISQTGEKTKKETISLKIQ